ncbi:phosphoglucosamine mutase family protein [Trifolium repens]|nr:phosphoglucosamine mutase family protein [Trifolium repens]
MQMSIEHENFTNLQQSKFNFDLRSIGMESERTECNFNLHRKQLELESESKLESIVEMKMEMLESESESKGIAISEINRNRSFAISEMNWNQKRSGSWDNYAKKKKINYGWAHDSSLACFGLMIDGKLLATSRTRGTLQELLNLRLPNRIPNREDKTTMKAITKVVFDNKVDLGIVFDTDVEGSAAVDSTGCEFNRNRLIGLMAVIVLEEVRL